MTGLVAPRTYELTWKEAGSGPPVVLVHAFPVDNRLFAGQVSAASVGRIHGRVLAVDLPGFGGTPLPDPVPDVLTVDDIAASLASLIERNELQRPIVGGVAIGAYSAIELAARRPELVGGLILMAVKAAPDSPAMAEEREALARRAVEQGSASIAEELHAQPLGPQADGAVGDQMRQMIETADPRAIAALVRGIARRPDPSPTLAGLAQPTLILAGERDPFSHVDDVRKAARLVPNARFQTIGGAGHMLPLEAPIAVSQAIARFVEESQRPLDTAVLNGPGMLNSV